MRKLVVAVALSLSAATVLAHEHKVLGTMTISGVDRVVMTTTEGKTLTVTITPDTKVTRGKAPVRIASVKPGTRIVVTTESDEAPYAAISIQVGAVPASPAKKK